MDLFESFSLNKNRFKSLFSVKQMCAVQEVHWQYLSRPNPLLINYLFNTSNKKDKF